MFVTIWVVVLAVLAEALAPPSLISTTRRDMFEFAVASSGIIPSWRGTTLRLVSPEEAADSDIGVFARYPDPVLRVSAKSVSRFDEKLRQIVKTMIKTGRSKGAVGLAATQCGIDAQIVVLGDQVFCNPRIVHRSEETEMQCWRERCLVLPPDVVVETLRDKEIRVEALDVDGNRFTQTLAGESARAFQHEHDHMRGILIVDHAAELVSSSIYPPLKALEAPYHHQRRTVAWERSIA